MKARENLIKFYIAKNSTSVRHDQTFLVVTQVNFILLNLTLEDSKSKLCFKFITPLVVSNTINL
jgi:hypothetical protein